MNWSDVNLITILKKGGVAVMPTDTIYGVVGRAEDLSTVNRIYNLKKRAPEKPCIILISDISELQNFSVALTSEQESKIKELWANKAEETRPTSIILDCANQEFSYLHRGTSTLAFRLPQIKELRDLLAQTGPLVAPSANPESLPPAENIAQAKEYFGLPAQTGEGVDLYIDGGELKGQPSRLIKLHKDGTINILRE